ncbi:hypothetical protein E5221_16295 [Pseudomonas sp. A2]|nr:hypothetical protein E5221_16295 [Pseudomonas sp. A2]
MYRPLRSTRLLLQRPPQTSDICSLRDSAAQKGWVISHRDPTGIEYRGVPVGAGLPANGPGKANRLIQLYV